jgi:hypothetical protein
LKIIDNNVLYHAHVSADINKDSLSDIIDIALMNPQLLCSIFDISTYELCNAYDRSIMNDKSYYNVNATDLSSWVNDVRSKIISMNYGDLQLMSYVLEMHHLYYANSKCDAKETSGSSSILQGAFLVRGSTNNYIPFHACNVDPFSSVVDHLDLQNIDMRTGIYNNNYRQLSGIIYISADVMSRLTVGFVNAFNAACVIDGSSFISSDDVYNSVFDNRVNLYDNPLSKYGYVRYGFDHEGSNTKIKCLLKKGVVNDLLSDSSTRIHYSNITSGNCFRNNSDIGFSIMSTNPMLIISGSESTVSDSDYKIDSYLDSFTFQSMFDIQSAKIKGVSFGRAVTDVGIEYCNYYMDLDIRVLFEKIIWIGKHKWLNGAYAPEVICNL